MEVLDSKLHKMLPWWLRLQVDKKAPTRVVKNDSDGRILGQRLDGKKMGSEEGRIFL